MILGASTSDIVAFLVVLGVSLVLGIVYLAECFVLVVTKSKLLRFIYDFTYAIIVGGVFVYTMYRLCDCDIKYYHVLALISGIILTGILPSSAITSRRERILAHYNATLTRILDTRLVRIIKK